MVLAIQQCCRKMFNVYVCVTDAPRCHYTKRTLEGDLSPVRQNPRVVAVVVPLDYLTVMVDATLQQVDLLPHEFPPCLLQPCHALYTSPMEHHYESVFLYLHGFFFGKTGICLLMCCTLFFIFYFLVVFDSPGLRMGGTK